MSQSSPPIPSPHALQIFGLAILVVVAAGTVHNFLISGEGASASLHPISAFGYAALGLGLIFHEWIRRGTWIWPLVSGTIVLVSLQKLSEVFIPGWFQVLNAPIFLNWKSAAGFNSTFSIGTAIALVSLHMSFNLARQVRSVALLFLGIATAGTLFNLLSLSFQLILWTGDLSQFSLAAMMFGSAAMTYALRNAALMRPLFSHAPYGFFTRTLVVGAILVPWISGAFYVRNAQINPEDLFGLQLAFALIGWIMLALVLIIGHAMEGWSSALKRAIRNDPLIRLRTRQGLSESFKQVTDHQGVILFDLDNFETFSEIHGYELGNQVMRDIARGTSSSLRHGDILARWGGTQFLAVLPVPNEDGLMVAAERLRALVESLNPETIGSNEPRITASFGVSMVQAKETNIDGAAERAEEALFAAKALGQNRVVRASSLPINDRDITLDKPLLTAPKPEMTMRHEEDPY
ncbi:diguanylate cyclase/phosphodiesterase (GGDEF & EAL domains) with PAS/PAC sensor(s) [Rhodovulum sp. P5]|uniref:GGDEF domain-containing protein n=1 Tax=Rhodovulum sp. P5 TaxID=1564506 RepID=UPI0009C3BA6C|nr:GGDEF domain-containing protein [Rhodovulum sp. P5]ARE38423.1 diguanylate cyclase/phosphodiesterase (GGDEF & EAL domains) with PAS/PAC sensor(s) [Rhodovulum sp. P5]